MPAASKEAIQQHQVGKQSGENVAKGISHLILVRSVTGEPRTDASGAQDFIA
jgi:hypothetical protein